MRSIIALIVVLSVLPAQAPAPATPAALAVGADCAAYAKTHTLVRNDVLAKMDAAEENLPKCEATLAKAQADLLALNDAFDRLRDHVDLLERMLKEQREVCAAGRTPAGDVEDAVAAAWEWADAPLAFTAGAGMCVGLAWGLTQVQR